MQRTILSALWALTTAICVTFPSAWAADAASKVMYFYCYGPQTPSGAPPPLKVYVSGVSSTVYTATNSEAAKNAYRRFIADKYGADFEPRCEYSGTELAAKRLLSLLQGRYRGDAEMTGWTWSDASAAAPAQP